ncbi:MBL fold metallo-hydrolase [Georgenia sp. SYP-B2076]|uniref:MBL fold metallo-hydrolase n=1 Tax=Georgenia sp. SYP-B2076 TaxID=2495881 RepID=UPI000F8D5C10|nr:MBL fold metallo-hydrolase [Georgenia sp. SYP-B2076]
MTSLVAVADGVLVATHPFCTTTTTVVLGADGGCLVVDPAVTAAEIDALAAELAALGRRVTAGFSTHPHWDHLLWRPALGEAPRYATSLGARTALGRLAENVAQARDAAPDADVTALARVAALPAGPTTLPWDGPTVRVLEHRAHAPGHAALLVPHARTLVAGDMVSDVEIPLPDHDAADPLGDYDRALDLIADLLDAGPLDVVVPGHGTVGDRAQLRRRVRADRRYLADVRAGRPVHDARLADGADWLRREHAVLLERVAAGEERR